MLDFDDMHRELEEIINERSIELSIAIITAICDGLDNDIDSVDINILKDMGINVNLKKENFLHALEINFQRIHDAEMYELCARAKSAIEKLKQVS